MYCCKCGNKINSSVGYCENCDVLVVPKDASTTRTAIIAFLMCVCFGFLGLHRFYAGKIKSAILILVLSFLICFLVINSYNVMFLYSSLGLSFVMFIWLLIDLIRITCGVFTDNEGKKIYWKLY